MKKLILKEILILSPQEKAARKILLDPKRTIIWGNNSTGKSSLIKSIYKTFGAEAEKVDKKWQLLNPYTFVKFEVEGKSYSILQTNDTYSIFDDQDKLLKKCISITRELTPILADILDFKISIRDREGKMSIPPPQYMFLPFYVDQDAGWSNSWSSFKSLGQLPKWKSDLVNYFSGVRPNEYYELKGKINTLQEEIKKNEEEKEILNNLMQRIGEDALEANFDIDIESFKRDIEKLIEGSEELQKSQLVLKENLVGLHNIKSSLIEQIEITKHALTEINEDYHFVSEEIEDDSVECPTCGANYDNSFAERFSIAKDEDKCKELLLSLNKELQEIEEKISVEKSNYDEKTHKMSDISKTLNSKRQNVVLKDLLKIEGKREVRSSITSDIEEIKKNLYKLEQELKELKKEINKFVDKDRKTSIEEKYQDYMKSYLYKLNVLNISTDAYKTFTNEIKLIGSEQPRALLSYYFSFFNLMQNYSSSAYCPVIIDSPNQQAQDQDNIKTILNFIKENQPEETQLILGLEDKYDIDFNCKVIELTKRYHLLQEENYPELNLELKKYMDQVII